MTAISNVFIQLDATSIVKLVQTLDLLKQHNIPYQLVENRDADKSVLPKNKTRNVNKFDKKQLGTHGLEILKYLSNGLTYVEVAEKTGITIDGVRYYIKKIFKALNVNNGRDAVRVYLTEWKD